MQVRIHNIKNVKKKQHKKVSNCNKYKMTCNFCSDKHAYFIV